MPPLQEVGIDGMVLLFALGVSRVAGLACGLAPALWQSQVEARGEVAREAASSALGFNLFRRSRGRALLVVVQVSLAVILLPSSGVLIWSFLKLSSVNPGYMTTRVLTLQVPLALNQSALLPRTWSQALSGSPAWGALRLEQEDCGAREASQPRPKMGDRWSSSVPVPTALMPPIVAMIAGRAACTP